MKKILIFVVLMVCVTSFWNVFAEGDLFEDSAVNAGAMKQEQLAERKYSAGKTAEGDDTLAETVSAVGRVIEDDAGKAYFTCDSNPADFNGKEFEDLYVLLNGCSNLDSTVIQGEDAFLTLRDIRVNGTLWYVDDNYNRETSVYRDAVLGESLTTADHFLNIAGDSFISTLHMECIDPHTCNFGIQFPTRVFLVEANPVHRENEGKMVIRGYIDPLVDEATDYYHDLSVASFPYFDITTFDLDRVQTATEDIERFDFVNYLSVYGGMNLTYPWGLYYVKNSGLISDEEFEFLKRGYINMMDVYNGYAVEPGETVIELGNIEIGDTFIENIGYPNRTNEAQYLPDHNWIPLLRSRGFTTIGTLNTAFDFHTDAAVPAPYSLSTDDPEKMVLPLYIDMVTVGGEGKTTTYNMENTRVAMLNYLGDEITGSQFVLKTGKINSPVNMPMIGIANIMGGAFSMSCQEATPDIPTIEELNFFEENPEFRFADLNAYKSWITNFPYDDPEIYLYITDPKTGGENLNNKDLREHRTQLIEAKILSKHNFARTFIGYFEIAKTLDSYLKVGSVDMAGKSQVHFYGENISLGDINASEKLGSISDWMDGRCHFWQHGIKQMTVGKIK